MSKLATLCVLCLLLLGCASSSEPATNASAAPAESPVDDSSSSGSESTAGSTTEPAVANEAEGSDSNGGDAEADVAYVSPIGEALGVAQDEITQSQVLYLEEAEELVRSCMAEAGFDYTPIANALDESTKALGELEASLSREAFIEQYGFGIATLFELDFQGNGVLNFVNDQFGAAPTEPRSAGEQAAYEIALTGETIQGLSTEEAQEQLFGNINLGAPGSCRQYGYSTAENPGAAYDDLFSLLGDELDSLIERYDSDPRIRDERRAWQGCMAGLGHSYESEFEIRDELFDRANTLATEFLSSRQVLVALGEAQEVGFTQMNADDRYEFLDEVGALQGFSWVPEVQEAFDALVAFELVVANDSQGCSDVALQDEVRFELETEFVQAHSGQLALIAAGES